MNKFSVKKGDVKWLSVDLCVLGTAKDFHDAVG